MPEGCRGSLQGEELGTKTKQIHEYARSTLEPGTEWKPVVGGSEGKRDLPPMGATGYAEALGVAVGLNGRRSGAAAQIPAPSTLVFPRVDSRQEAHPQKLSESSILQLALESF